MRRNRTRRSPIWFFNSAKRASTFLRARWALAKAGVLPDRVPNVELVRGHGSRFVDSCLWCTELFAGSRGNVFAWPDKSALGFGRLIRHKATLFLSSGG